MKADHINTGTKLSHHPCFSKLLAPINDLIRKVSADEAISHRATGPLEWYAGISLISTIYFGLIRPSSSTYCYVTAAMCRSLVFVLLKRGKISVTRFSSLKYIFFQ
jgi:transposase